MWEREGGFGFWVKGWKMKDGKEGKGRKGRGGGQVLFFLIYSSFVDYWVVVFGLVEHLIV